MRVLILGGAGYIGSVLSNYLLEKNQEVVVFDNFLYQKKITKSDQIEYIEGDITNINDLLPAITAADAIVNLAAISNDPASDLQPELTWEINYKANQTIAGLCKATKKRVIYASSCSVYGFSEKGTFKEKSNLNPVTLYARTKMLSEEFYLDKNVNSVILRFATVYGNSPKPRFDLVVNTMTGTSYFTGEIVVNGGSQWRPIVHVQDVAQAIYLALTVKNPKSRIYNVGSNTQNYQIKDLAIIISKTIKNIKVTNNAESVDGRSYKVDFSKISKELNFKATFGIQDAVSELYSAFKTGVIKNMQDDEYFRVKYLLKNIHNKDFIKKLTPIYMYPRA